MPIRREIAKHLYRFAFFASVTMRSKNANVLFPSNAFIIIVIPIDSSKRKLVRAKSRYIVIKMTIVTSGAFKKPILTSHRFKPLVKLYDMYIYIYVNVTCFVEVEKRVDTNKREKMQLHSREKVHRCTRRESKVKNSIISLPISYHILDIANRCQLPDVPCI